MEQLTGGTDSGGRIPGLLHESPTPEVGLPLLVALNGGRPGYGGSDLLPEAENTFARQAELLDARECALLAARKPAPAG